MRVFRYGDGTVYVELDRYEARRLADEIWSAGGFANEVARAITVTLDEDEQDEED